MDFGENSNEKMIIITTGVHLRNCALLCLKEPLQCITSAVDIGQIMLSCCNIIGFLHPITILSCILDDIISRLIGTHEWREFVISLAVSFIREDNILLDNGSNILVGHGLTAEHLNNDIALWQNDILGLIDSHHIQTCDIVLGVIVHRRRVLILLCGHPCLLTSLPILLSYSLKISAGL